MSLQIIDLTGVGGCSCLSIAITLVPLIQRQNDAFLKAYDVFKSKILSGP